VAQVQLNSETQHIPAIDQAGVRARVRGAAWGMRQWLLLFCAVGLITVRAWSAMAVVVLGGPNRDQGRLPSDWQLKEHSGKPEIAGCSENEGFCVHLTSVNSSFSLEHSVELDPAELPYLSWSWKVTRLPMGADFRKPSTDDQAAQLLIAFSDRHVLSYIWDSNAPKGTMQSAGAIPLVHIVAVVCESGAAETNRWVNETRNLAADYQRAFGRPAPRIKGVRLQINTQHTGSRGESFFGPVSFRSTPD
jgi:hypothetical protein